MYDCDLDIQLRWYYSKPSSGLNTIVPARAMYSSGHIFQSACTTLSSNTFGFRIDLAQIPNTTESRVLALSPRTSQILNIIPSASKRFRRSDPILPLRGVSL
jgi:hypothetical protein